MQSKHFTEIALGEKCAYSRRLEKNPSHEVPDPRHCYWVNSQSLCVENQHGIPMISFQGSLEWAEQFSVMQTNRSKLIRQIGSHVQNAFSYRCLWISPVEDR